MLTPFLILVMDTDYFLTGRAFASFYFYKLISRCPSQRGVLTSFVVVK